MDKNLKSKGPGSLTPLAPISMQEMKLSSGNLLDHPSFQGKRTQPHTHPIPKQHTHFPKRRHIALIT